MNKIVLITTQGCQGCIIARNSINEALAETNKDVTFEELDCKNVQKKYLKKFGITDYPAILFFRDDELKVKKTGSVPAIIILRWINLNFW